MKSFGYAAASKSAPLSPWTFLRGRARFPHHEVFSLLHYNE